MTQLDLFGEIEAEEERQAAQVLDVHRQAVEFLTYPWPDMLAWWIDPDGATIERRLDHGSTPCKYRSGRPGDPDWRGWAWSTWRDGLHFQAGDEWAAAGAWSHRPSHVIPWSTLHQLRDAHPAELAELRRLSTGRGKPFGLGWRWYAEPAILSPWGWHPSYYESEREQSYYTGDTFGDPAPADAYAARLKAWAIVVELAAQLGPEVRP